MGGSKERVLDSREDELCGGGAAIYVGNLDFYLYSESGRPGCLEL